MAETFETLAAKNPYSQENRAQYNMGAIETLMHDWLGFRTGIDKYNEEMDNRSKEYLAQLATVQREEQYNSPEEQAARMRAAGLNPDISTQMNPGQASEFTEQETAPESPLGEDMKTVDIISKLGFQMLDTLIGGFSLKNAFKQTGIANEIMQSNRDLQEDEGLMESVYKAIEDFGSDEEFENGAYIAAQKGLTGKRYEKFARMYDQTWRSMKGLIARTKTDTNAKTALRENALVDKVYDIKDKMAEAELEAAQIETEKNKREAEFLKEHPEYNQAELEAGILQHEEEQAKADKVFAQWRSIQAEADGKIADLYSRTINSWDKTLEAAGYLYGKVTGNQIPGLIIKGTRVRRARKYYNSKEDSEIEIGDGKKRLRLKN